MSKADTTMSKQIDNMSTNVLSAHLMGLSHDTEDCDKDALKTYLSAAAYNLREQDKEIKVLNKIIEGATCRHLKKQHAN